jgi:hypothetical protein
MAWSASAIFRSWATTIMFKQTAPTGGTGEIITNDTVKAALFNNSITPDKDATLATSGYNSAASQWLVANEVTDVTNWVAGGRALGTKTLTQPSSGVNMFDAADLAGGGTLTLTATYGCLTYDSTITGGTVNAQGICFNYFGGAQQVTSGTFTIVWNANGVLRLTF